MALALEEANGNLFFGEIVPLLRPELGELLSGLFGEFSQLTLGETYVPSPLPGTSADPFAVLYSDDAGCGRLHDAGGELQRTQPY